MESVRFPVLVEASASPTRYVVESVSAAIAVTLLAESRGEPEIAVHVVPPGCLARTRRAPAPSPAAHAPRPKLVGPEAQPRFREEASLELVGACS